MDALPSGPAGETGDGRYRATLDHILEGCQLIGFDWTYLYLNDAAAKHNRRPNEELLGRKMMDAWPGIESTTVFAMLRRCMYERVALHQELDFEFSDGSRGWYDVRCQPVPEGLFALSINISERKLHERELERVTRMYNALSHVNQVIVRTSTREELYQRICKGLVEHGGFCMAWIGLVAEDHRLLPVADWGDARAYVNTLRIYTDDRIEGRGPSGTAFRQERTYICNDFFNDPATLPWRPEAERRGIRASAVFPIRQKGKVCGTLNVYAREPGFFQDKEVALLEEAAADLSFALDNIRREEERVRAEAAVHREQDFSTTMIDSMPGIVYMYNESRRFLRWNRNFMDVSGYSAKEIEGMHPLDFFKGEDRIRVGQRIAEVFDFGNSFIEAHFVAKDGTATPYYFTGRRIYFHGQACLIGMGIDVSERTQAIEALRNSEERFRQVVENIREVFWVTDPAKNEMLYISPAYETIWGRSCASLYESPRTWLDAIHPDDRARVVHAAWTNQVKGTYDEQYRIQRPDGSERWIRDRAFPIFNEAGDVHRIVGTAEDMTEHRRMEEQLRQSQRMESIGLLAGGIAHDFNNLLTIINGRCELLRYRFKAEDMNRRELELIYKTGQRAAHLTRQLLAFSRQQVLAPKVLDLNTVVENVEEMLRRLIPANIKLTTKLDSRLRRVHADPGQLEQIIINLIVNARDAMPEGGTLTIETANADVNAEDHKTLPDLAVGKYAKLVVSDTGEGMSAEVKARIFEPFFTTKAQGKGTGLGLSMVFGIVKQSLGHIDVSSDAGRGSTFTVYLPESPKPLTEARDETTAKVQGTANETVLVVEDEDGVRDLLHELLQNQGYQVLLANDGERALHIFERHSGTIHLVISDMVMPRLGGLELLKRLRALRPDIKFLLTTGYVENNEIHEALPRSGVGFLQKPFDVDALQSKVREILDSV